MWVRWGPVGSGGDRLCQTRLISRSPDGDKKGPRKKIEYKWSMVHRYCFTDLGSIVWIENDKRLKLDPSISFMICYTPRAESALQRIWESTTNPPPGQSVNLGYQWAISYFWCRLHERKLKIPNSNLFKQTQIMYLIPWQIKSFDIPSCKFSRIEPAILLSRTYILPLSNCL